MATVFRRAGSPYFYTAFFDAEGRRRYRSTKQKRKTDAVKVASEMEIASLRVGDDQDSRKLLAILEEATEKAIRGQMNVNVARGYLERLLEAATGERLYDPSIEDWLMGWLEERTGMRCV